MELSPKKIYSEVEKTASYQQEELFKHYKGLDIKGVGKLLSVDTDNSFMLSAFNVDTISNGVFVHMSEADGFYPIIWCYTDLNKYPELKFSKKGQSISFKGKIKEVTSTDIYVINPEFIFQKEGKISATLDSNINFIPKYATIGKFLMNEWTIAIGSGLIVLIISWIMFGK